MENKNLLPIDTPQDRLKIYKLALKEDLTGLGENGLCIKLRNLSGRDFTHGSYHATPHTFPEFGKYYGGIINGIQIVEFKELYDKPSRRVWRTKVLNLIISEIEGKPKQKRWLP